MKYFSVIYMYTTPIRIPQGRVKVGSARRKANSAYEVAKIRVAEQQAASTSDEPLKILEFIDVSDICETGGIHKTLSNLRTLEKSIIHKKMKSWGMWYAGEPGKDDIKDTSEWFFGKTTKDVVDVVKSLINQKRFGVTRPNSFKMRQEQQECHDKAIEHFKNGGFRFLINGKMRIGKNFITYNITKTISSWPKNRPFKVLILSYKPSTSAGWREDVEEHVDFDGWEYRQVNDFIKGQPITLNDSTAKVTVLFASFQDLNQMQKSKWSEIVKQHFDLVVIDEQHYGIETSRAKATLDALSYDRIIEVSGTPLHALMSGKFLDNEIYSWSYADEQRKRKAEKETGWKTEIYRWMPELHFMIFQISDEAKSQCKYYTKEEGFTIPKYFASDDGETFNDESAVSRFLEELCGLTGHKTKSPLRQYNPNHMICKLPSVNACNAMKKLIQRLGYINYEPIVVSGDQGENLDGVKAHIKKYPKTITLTCGSLMTGTTVAEWDMIIMLDGCKSPQEYFQTLFRVQSMNKSAGKEKCYVVDYNPQRNLQMIYEYACVQSISNNKSVQQNLSEFLDFAPIMDHTGNRPVRKNIEDVLDEIAHSSTAIEKFGSGLNINISIVDEEVKNILMNVIAEKGSMRETIVNDNGIKLGKNKNVAPRTKNPSIFTKSEITDLQRKAITTLKNIPNYLWVEEGHIDNINDIYGIGNDEVFMGEVGISLDNFKKLCDLGFINRKRLEQCILAFQQICKDNATRLHCDQFDIDIV